MKVAFRSSFNRDLKKVKDKELLRKVKECILDAERANSMREMTQVKKISSSSGYYRIRVQEYRLGVYISGDEIEFVRFMHRRDVYKYFP